LARGGREGKRRKRRPFQEESGKGKVSPKPKSSWSGKLRKSPQRFSKNRGAGPESSSRRFWEKQTDGATKGRTSYYPREREGFEKKPHSKGRSPDGVDGVRWGKMSTSEEKSRLLRSSAEKVPSLTAKFTWRETNGSKFRGRDPIFSSRKGEKTNLWGRTPFLQPKGVRKKTIIWGSALRGEEK